MISKTLDSKIIRVTKFKNMFSSSALFLILPIYGVGTMAETELKLGGYIKIDTMLTDYSAGASAGADIGEDFLVPVTIPVVGESGNAKFHAHAKSSRLFLSTNTPLAEGWIKTQFEFDSIGSVQGDERVSNSYSPRLRHVFLNWRINDKNGLIAGQTWSTFLYEDALPEKIDLVGPVGTILQRQALVRYTHFISEEIAVDIALENPSTTLYQTEKTSFDENRYPDLMIRYKQKMEQMAFSLAAMWRELRYERTQEDGDVEGVAEYGYGLSAAAKYNIGRDDIRVMVSAGDALGRYMGLNGFRAGSIAPAGEINLSEQWGGFISVRHYWNDNWRSNFIYSVSQAENPVWESDTVPHEYKSLHVNFMYSPQQKLTLGSEYIYAEKSVENRWQHLHDRGKVSRLQFSIKYAF